MIRSLKSLDRVLKGQATDDTSLRQGNIDISARGLSILLIFLGAIYGVCMGAFSVITRWGMGQARLGFLQMGYSAAKVPMLFMLTLAITLPSLYVFNALVGCRLLFSAVVRLLVAALGVTLAVLASFGTITAFFSLCTTSYSFMVLLNVLVFALAGLLGMGFLLKTLRRISAVQSLPQIPADPAVPVVLALPASINSQARTVFVIWVVVFALVGAQMGWILRPFIGAPTSPVTFFRAREGNFFQAVGDKVADVSVGTAPKTRENSTR